MQDNRKRAIIIGAGPAGLTAAYEFATRTDIIPIVIEASDLMGGISRTVNYKGNRIDIGGHRFFSKSERVMEWWMKMMPVEKTDSSNEEIFYHGKSNSVDTSKGVDSLSTDQVMLIRNRKSRIYFLRNFFDYPIKLSIDTLKKLGFLSTIKIGLSYIKIRLFPIPKSEEKNLEQFFINRFGKELYETFFKSYTEKVWGIECHNISSEWGAQRIKGLSISEAIRNFIKKAFEKKKIESDIFQKNTETSLIEKFMYPKYGPGQMWDTCAERIKELGGEIQTNKKCIKWFGDNNAIRGVEILNLENNQTERIEGDYYFSTVPIKELINNFEYTDIPTNVKEISEGLLYRDFLTVGLLCSDLLIKDKTPAGDKLVTDNWIYIQEKDVKIGRLQIFNNWSPYLIDDQSNVWIGLEYFVNEGDDLWEKSESDMIDFGIEELVKINIIERKSVIDSTVIKMPKTYPAYFGTYDRIDELKRWVSNFENLFLIGRNGMHKYNNQDHSMLTAMVSVDNIIANNFDKDNIWDINTEEDYHENK